MTSINEGKYECWSGDTVDIVSVKGEPKAKVTVSLDYEGEQTTVETWHTLDPQAVTQTGKKRLQFTIDALKALGAVDPMRDIGTALENDPAATKVRLEGLGTEVAILEAKQSGQFMNYNVYAKRKPVAKGFGSSLLAFADSKKKGAAGESKVNPFAPRPGTGQPVSPPPPKPGGEDDSFDPDKLSEPEPTPEPEPEPAAPKGKPKGKK